MSDLPRLCLTSQEAVLSCSTALESACWLEGLIPRLLWACTGHRLTLDALSCRVRRGVVEARPRPTSQRQACGGPQECRHGYQVSRPKRQCTRGAVSRFGILNPARYHFAFSLDNIVLALLLLNSTVSRRGMSSDDEDGGNDAIGALLFGDVDELSEVPWSC